VIQNPPPFETIHEKLREALASSEGVRVSDVHPLVSLVRRESGFVVLTSGRVWDRARDLLLPFADAVAQGHALIVLVGSSERADVQEALARGIATVVSAEPTLFELELAVRRSFELLGARQRADKSHRSAERYEFELDELLHIARAMSTERDVDRLLGLILEKSRFVTGADAGSIYVVEGGATETPVLRFKLTQNESVHFDSREFTMPLSHRSVAGSSALSRQTIRVDDVYSLPSSSPFKVDRSFDEKTGYRTKSMVALPLVSQRGEVIGVIQLINKKVHPAQKLVSSDDFASNVVPFDDRSVELLGMLAAQAGASLETAMLYGEIRALFEGFVKASVEAIESRDPTTSGHSRRVADLTTQLARAVVHAPPPTYRDIRFDDDDMREIEYASLLHDFGKIGVREKILVKAKKLYDEQLTLIQSRFEYVAKAVEADVLTRKVRELERGASRDDLRAFDEELAHRLGRLRGAFDAILSANEPQILTGGDFERIEAIAQETFTDSTGTVHRLLSEPEVAALSIRRGSLTASEFDEIRSHVSHTFKFLSQIPWGKSLRRVPLIAGAHHERLNGTGYPNRLTTEAIPIQSKMMSIADIYDALTAADRPYKKAVPLERALDILGFGVKDGHIDGDLVEVFRQARVWERVGDDGHRNDFLGSSPPAT
jgi:HD-GYP domain-containing protein (c-di-GMP phosphodiesterase class II)